MDIAAWLRGLGLEQYDQAFRDNAVEPEVLPDLDDADLEKLGVLLGHRKRLLRAITVLRASAAGPRAPAAPPGRVPAAERRQLTVMFVDLVGSTALSTRLDPEDLRGLIRAYQDAVAAEVARYEGHVAKFMGDGVLAYFGWPRAHEDDAERAVRAGLAAVAAVGLLAPPAGGGGGAGSGGTLAARVGVATGLVVVGDLLGEGAAREEAVIGETPNLAARLQALAEPGAVVVGEATRRLLGGLFELEELPATALKGFAGTPRAFRVRGEGRRAGDRFEALRGAGLTPLVGRDDELAALLGRWERAAAGEGGVVLLAGEAGIGKSRLLRAFRERLAGRPHVPLVQFCSPFHRATPLHPVTDLLERTAGFARDDPPARRLDKLETMLADVGAGMGDAAPLLAALLSVPAGDRYPPLALTPQRQRERTLETLVGLLAGLARQAPVLEVFEDVHWADPTTLEVMDLVVERVRALPMLSVMTFRPEFAPRWAGRSHVTLLSLERLGHQQGMAIVGHLTGGRALPAEILEQIAARTDGVPLFVEELTKTVLESGLLRGEGDRYALSGPLPPLAIPATLQDSLMARLDRLALVKEVAQVGAAIGREFGHELLAAVVPLGADELARALDGLAEAELVFRRGTPPDATYTFKHALVRDAAYRSLLRSRRQQLHACLARVLEERFPEVAETQPEVLARHCAEAGLTEKGIDYWCRAGRGALARSAMAEAVAQLTRGLDLLRTLPESPERRHQELDLQVALGSALSASKGFATAETVRAYARAHTLCAGGGAHADPIIFSALHGWFSVRYQRAELSAALEIARELLSRAEERGDVAARVTGHRLAGSALYHLGSFAESRAHFEAGLALYDPARDRTSALTYVIDSRVICSSWLAHALLVLGHPEQAVARKDEALAWARELAHPNSTAHALIVACILHGHHRPGLEALTEAEELIALATEQGFPFWAAAGMVVHGWVLADGGRAQEGIEEARRGLAEYTATGSVLWVPDFLALLAQTHGRADQAATGLELLADALDQVEKTEGRWLEVELLRLRGDLLLALPDRDPAAAEACFRRAIDVARDQAAKWWELSAATSLARLWAGRGERREAHDLLAPVHGWFTEGFDTPALKEAKALLDAL